MRFGGLIAALSLAAVVGATARCDNDATGVEACRRIERRKCEVALGCPGRVQEESDVITCKSFYRDQCLFGMADGADPDPTQTDACLAAIGALEACKGAATLAECDDPPAVSCPGGAAWCDGIHDPINQAPCTILFRTELLDDCAFLRPPPPEGGEGGGTGGGGGSGGAGGDGGSGGTGG